jgi:hypothetical protein
MKLTIAPAITLLALVGFLDDRVPAQAAPCVLSKAEKKVWAPCTIGFDFENEKTWAPKWAVKKAAATCTIPIVSWETGKPTGECLAPDRDDGVWQHALCDRIHHRIRWCLP